MATEKSGFDPAKLDLKLYNDLHRPSDAVKFQRMVLDFMKFIRSEPEPSTEVNTSIKAFKEMMHDTRYWELAKLRVSEFRELRYVSTLLCCHVLILCSTHNFGDPKESALSLLMHHLKDQLAMPPLHADIDWEDKLVADRHAREMEYVGLALGGRHAAQEERKDVGKEAPKETP